MQIRIKKTTATEFGRVLHTMHPGVPCTCEALADWRRRTALSFFPLMGMVVGSVRSMKYLATAGL